MIIAVKHTLFSSTIVTHHRGGLNISICSFQLNVCCCFSLASTYSISQVFIHIHQGCFAGTGAIVRLPQCQWSKPDGYGKISQCITTTKHSKTKTVCISLGIYCSLKKYMHTIKPLLYAHWIPKLKCFSFCPAVVFVPSIELRCLVQLPNRVF